MKWSRDNETGTKFEKMILVTLLLCEHIGRIIFPPDVVDHALVKNDRLPNRATTDVQVFHCLVKNALSPIDSTFVVAEHLSRFGHLGEIEVRHHMAKMLHRLCTFIGGFDFGFGN